MRHFEKIIINKWVLTFKRPATYKGEISPDKNRGIEARFFSLNQLPHEIDPFIKNKLVELKGQLDKIKSTK